MHEHNAMIMEGANTFFSSYKIPLGTRKYFFEIYRQYGHTSSKCFASSGLGYELDGQGTPILFSALSRNFCFLQRVGPADPLTWGLLRSKVACE